MHAYLHRFTASAKLIERMEARLQAQSWPRFQMALIVAFTVGQALAALFQP